MKTAHLRTEGLHDEHEAASLEQVVRHARGVEDIASVRSMHLISVLYDERLASVPALLGTVRRAGYRARAYRPGALSR